MTRISDDQFMHNFEESTVVSPDDKTKTEESAKATGKSGPSSTSSVTVDEAPPQQSSGSGSIPIALVPPPPGDPALTEAQIQSLQSKLSANQMSASSNQMATDTDKMQKAIKKYNDDIKKQQEEDHKSHSKNLIKNICDDVLHGVEDLGMAAVGVALMITPVPGARIAGAVVLACTAVMISDQVATGQFGNKPLVHGKAAEVFNDVGIAATVVGAVATMGGGAAIGGAAAATDVAEDTGDAVEMADMSSQASDSGDAGNVGDEDGDEVGDSGGGSGGSSDIEMTERGPDSSMARMEEEFEETFEDTSVEDAGSDGSGDGDGDDSGRLSRAKKAVTVLKRVNAMVAAAQGGTDGVMNILIGRVDKKAQDDQADATGAQKDIKVAAMDDQQVVGVLQNEMQQYEAINQDLTSLIMSYGQTKTDTAVQGYA